MSWKSDTFDSGYNSDEWVGSNDVDSVEGVYLEDKAYRDSMLFHSERTYEMIRRNLGFHSLIKEKPKT